MQTFAAAIDTYNAAQKKLLRLAADRNYVVADDGLVWCPVSVAKDARRLLRPGDVSLRAVIMELYLPGIQDDIPVPLSSLLSRIIDFRDNAWLHDACERMVRGRLDVYAKNRGALLPDERDYFDLYRQGALSSDELLHGLTTFDYLRIPQGDTDSYFFVPVGVPADSSGPRFRVPRSGASQSTHTVNTNRSQHFLYVDVGAWSGSRNAAGTGQAPFGLVSPDEVAIWDMMAPPSRVRLPDTNGIAAEFLKQYGEVLNGSLVFYARFFGDHFEMYERGLRRRFQYSVPIPFTADSLMVLIPDLHLHMFPDSAADNFLDPGRGGASLATYLVSVLDYAASFSRAHPVELYQLGDCYELWESALLLCFAEGQGLASYFTGIGSALALPQRLIADYRDSLRRDIEKRGLDKIFSQQDVQALETQKWNAPGLRPVWKRIQRCIQQAHRFKEIAPAGWSNRGIFRPDGRLDVDLPDWTIVGGNHDSFVTNVTPIRRGVNDAVFMEHGHLRDDKNCPEKILSGIFFTGLNAVAELKGVGDQIKSFEASRRELFQKNAGSVNAQPDYPYRKPAGAGPGHYSLVITGHTHRQYVSLLSLDSRAPTSVHQTHVLHEQKWPSRPWYFVESASDLEAAGRMLDNVARDAVVLMPGPLLVSQFYKAIRRHQGR